MKINKTKLLFIATLLFLAIPLAFSGNAGAAITAYQYDGAVHNTTSTGWVVPEASNGTCSDGVSTSVVDCYDHVYDTLNTQAACEGAGNRWDARHGACSVALKNQTRDKNNCELAGGTYYTATDPTPKVCVGKWTWTNTYSGNGVAGDGVGGSHDNCLRCHSTISQERSEKSYWKDSYLKTGHRNMLRKVTATMPWAGPDGNAYTVDSSGRTIDTSAATIDVGGTCAVGGNYAPIYTQAACEAVTGGVWTASAQSRQLYYIYGDWMAAAPEVVFADPAGGSCSDTTKKTQADCVAPATWTAKNTSGYTCASCHTTGYAASGKPQPAATYAGLTGITGTWQFDAIVCQRCHSDGVTEHHTATSTWESAAGNALCFGCHNSTKDANNPATKLAVGINHGASWGRDFNGHINGNNFLNSPHARFSGTVGQIGDKSKYGATHFAGNNDGVCTLPAGVTMNTDDLEKLNTKTLCTAVANASGVKATWTAGTAQGNCTTCHDVHQSLVAEVGAEEPLKRECGISCHASKGDLSTIKHPNTPGTPLYAAAEAGNVSDACVICHMATEAGTEFPVHLFRINTDKTYDLFPTAAEFADPTKRFAKVDADGAAWVDLDMACGQCHGGGADQDHPTYEPKYGAPYMTKAYLAVVAKGMHQGDLSSTTPTAAFKASYPSAVGLVATVVDASKTADSVKVNWGDGSSVAGTVGGTVTHTYKVAGTYPVTLTATNDESGLTSSVTVNLSVKPVQYTIGGTVTYFKANGTTPFNLEDCNGLLADGLTPEVAGSNCVVKKGAAVYVKNTATGSTVAAWKSVAANDTNVTAFAAKSLNGGRSFTVGAVRTNFTCSPYSDAALLTPMTMPITLSTNTSVYFKCVMNALN